MTFMTDEILRSESSDCVKFIVKGTHCPKTKQNGIDRMIDNPFWKVFFKKLNLGIIYLPRNVQKQ